MSLLQRLVLAGVILPGITTLPALAQSVDPAEESRAFSLGTIYLGADEEAQGGTTTTVTGTEAARQNRATLDDTLGVLPGVSATPSGGGSRNEREVFVRGFDRWHVPLSIDGIRIYLPADNRLDHGRFLTPDLAEIQVQKSYVSVINGPGGMGGAINLVTRKPTKAFEGEARLGLEAGNRGDVTGRNGYVSLGTKQEFWYGQLSYMRRDSDGYYLSRDYQPDPAFPYQGEGLRRDSATDDSRLNLKLGYTPNATDEYVLSYTRQEGEKSAPYSTLLPVMGYPVTRGGQRDWTWPEWDIESLAFYSTTELDEGTLKTKLFYNTFKNTLSAWDDADHDSQTLPRAFNSFYDDYSLGGSLEYGVTLGQHDLRFATSFRRDVHRATDHERPGDPSGGTILPTEHSKEETISLAVEDTWTLRDDLRLIAGLSYEKAKVIEANRTSASPGEPVFTHDAVNWQAAAVWTPQSGGEYHASLSSRTSFPTLFHRYSSGFGTTIPNPDLGPERALNFELGYKGDLGPVRLEGAVFYSRISDAIQAIGQPGGLTQRQNLSKATYQGFEVAASWEVSDTLALRGNYTFMDLKIDDDNITGAQVTDIPRHKAYVRLDWQALDRLTVSPSVEIYGSRWSDPAVGSGNRNAPIYTRMSGFGLANLDMSWQISEEADVAFGVRNIFDRNYSVVEGYPEEGRSFYLTSSIRF
ncbi:TonB-dependent receptor [Xinfangfangia sp. D13-10-4-6]|uniref:TonB-dependent receptor plug domain-containing protein n=1 Tax=Pseudogemmobacter hezensis TaxID=2737662 RepID=UPI001552FAA5|nr:TonB-dependent receptor [Pseudogemmobacter hezensis]NPD13918.1 TonB-dependent receptor [Pseudogemmobacter hezensis]